MARSNLQAAECSFKNQIKRDGRVIKQVMRETRHPEMQK